MPKGCSSPKLALALALVTCLAPLSSAQASSRGSLLKMRPASTSLTLQAPPAGVQKPNPWREPSHRLTYRDRTSRIAPMGVELTGVVLGAGLATAGAMFWGINGRCAEQGVIIGSGSPICLSTFDTRVAGIGTLTSGILLFGGSLAMLILDARRR